MSKNLYSIYLVSGIILLVFSLLNAFLSIKQSDEGMTVILIHLSHAVFAFVVILQSIKSWQTRKITTVLFLVFTIFWFVMLKMSIGTSRFFSNTIFLFLSGYLLINNIKELLRYRWYPLVYILIFFGNRKK